MIEEDEATGEVASLYEATKQALNMPFVPNMSKAVAIAPNVLAACTDIFRTFYSNLTLPQALVAMISYCIPTAKNCHYCSANGELYCRSLGIDEEVLEQLARDLGNVNPQRIRTIIQFALKCALTPQSLTAKDYDQIRDQGVGDEELVEIIFIASVANMTDTLADALKIEVDAPVLEALGR
jgi:uncharacterized peroxidase-related enzyme